MLYKSLRFRKKRCGKGIGMNLAGLLASIPTSEELPADAHVFPTDQVHYSPANRPDVIQVLTSSQEEMWKKVSE